MSAAQVLAVEAEMAADLREDQDQRAAAGCSPAAGAKPTLSGSLPSVPSTATEASPAPSPVARGDAAHDHTGEGAAEGSEQTPVAILRAARATLEAPERWLHDVEPVDAGARDADGREALPWSPAATRWDLGGAVEREQGTFGYHHEGAGAFRLLSLALTESSGGEIGWFGLVDWYDAPERTHAEVLELIDRAIARGEVRP